MNKKLEAAANQWVRKHSSSDQGPCLIPKEGRPGITCHERDYCECEMSEAYKAGAEWQAKQILELLRSDESREYFLNFHRENDYLNGYDWADWLEQKMKEGGA